MIGMLSTLPRMLVAVVLGCAVFEYAIASPGCRALNGFQRKITGQSNPALELVSYAQAQATGDGLASFVTNLPLNAGDTISWSATSWYYPYSCGPVGYPPPPYIWQSSDTTKEVFVSCNGPIPQFTMTFSVTCASVAPTLTSVNPATGPEGNAVTLTGTGFYGTSAVNFGAAAAPSFTVNSDQSITATAPAGTGTVVVAVTTDAGTTTTTNVTYTTQNTHTVTPIAGANGSISPATPQDVRDGAQIRFTVSADEGYTISGIGGCGGANVSGVKQSVYTTGPITADCVVEADFASIPVNINQHGLTGAWYDPTTSGQGLLIETYKDLVAPGQGYIAAGWFTFDVTSSGGQRWYTLQGAANSGSSENALGIYTAVGGNFNAAPKISASQVGTATLSFSDCATGSLNYSFNDGRAGTIPLRRIDPNITCSPASDNGNATQNYLLSGAWYDPHTSGQGFIFDVNPAINLLFAAWYTYAPNGASVGGGTSQRWYTIQDNAFAPGMTSKSGLSIYETIGGVFNSGKVGSGQPVGTASLTINSCTSLQLSYDFTSGTNAGQSGTINLSRVVTVPIGCTLQ